MPNLTIYLPKDVELKVRKAAKSQRTSVSRWVSERIAKLVDNAWSPEFLAAAGADPDFPEIGDLEYGPESPRETLG